jgi:hypothetical protein
VVKSDVAIVGPQIRFSAADFEVFATCFVLQLVWVVYSGCPEWCGWCGEDHFAVTINFCLVEWKLVVGMFVHPLTDFAACSCERFIVCRAPATSEMIYSGDDEVFVVGAGVGCCKGWCEFSLTEAGGEVVAIEDNAVLWKGARDELGKL